MLAHSLEKRMANLADFARCSISASSSRSTHIGVVVHAFGPDLSPVKHIHQSEANQPRAT